jgi:hypothetical protein
MADRRTWARRLVMPLTILIVAGGLAIWSGRQQQQQTAQVRRWAHTLCDDLECGRVPGPQLKTDAALTAPLATQLQAVADQANGRAGALSVVVTAGDAFDAGVVPHEATHTAVIRIDGADTLGLRVVHEGRPDDITIIGFWIPAAAP